MKAQVNRDVGSRVSQHSNIMASQLRDFTRMSPPEFYGSRSNEDPHSLMRSKILSMLCVGP